MAPWQWHVCNMTSILGFLVIFTGFPTPDAVYVYRQLTPLDHPEAKCNDGRPAHIFHTLGQPVARKFLLYLEGGGFCKSVESCETRCKDQPYYCSPLQNATYQVSGIFSEDPDVNPHFVDFYKVFVHYCTSDMFLGESEATDENGGFYYHGRKHVTAAVHSLQSLVGLQSGDLLVVAGTSAGGRGVIYNCQHVASLVPGVNVKCVVDAIAFYPVWDDQASSSDCKSFNEITAETSEFYNSTLGRDFDVNTWYTKFPLPLFIGMETFDHIGFMYSCMDPENPTHLEMWAEGMRAHAESLVKEHPNIGLYLSGCFGHPIMDSDHLFSTVKAGKERLTFAEVLSNWIHGEGPVHAWDDCTEEQLNCNTMCKQEQS